MNGEEDRIVRSRCNIIIKIYKYFLYKIFF